MKRAIYLDERERDLARRCFAVLERIIALRIMNPPASDDILRMAYRFALDGIEELARKFCEPEDQS